MFHPSTARFCMPGHSGRGALPLRLDVTEVDGTDNLRAPGGIIAQAQRYAAQAVGAKETFFLVGGSSVGLHALILSVCAPGDKLIVDRTCHISVLNALVFHDVRPVYLYPAFDAGLGIYTEISPAAVEEALITHPDAKGVLVTSPNYYGICAPLEALAAIAHRHGVPLLADEAHGAHFAFHPRLPASALSCGADGVAQSAHKTLPCVTQGAMLHLGSARICPERVLENLNLLHTTSPSYLILSSIDDAVAHMQQNGLQELEQTINACGAVREWARESGCLRPVTGDDFPRLDLTRLVLHAGAHADEVCRRLAGEHNIRIELCDGRNLVLIAKASHRRPDFLRLERALSSIASSLPPLASKEYAPPPRCETVLPPREAYYSKTEKIPAAEAAGRICARACYRTPPCTSVIAPGERITPQSARALWGEVTVVL